MIPMVTEQIDLYKVYSLLTATYFLQSYFLHKQKRLANANRFSVCLIAWINQYFVFLLFQRVFYNRYISRQ